MDPFAPIAEQEAEIIRLGTRKIEALEAQIRFCKAIQAVKAGPGWKEYCDSVAAVADAFNNRLLDEKEQKRDYLAGICSGLVMTMSIADKADANLKRFEQQLERLRREAEHWTHPT
jgi:hypothetical protein